MIRTTHQETNRSFQIVRGDWNAAPSRVVWITGAGGLIGSHIVQHAPLPWRAMAVTREQVDLTDFATVRAAFRQDQPSLVIHCAAMSKSPACEATPDLARKINVESTAVLAELARDIPFVFFSTDLIFDGAKGHYVEEDVPHPLTVYGRTKAEAEQIVLANPRHTVIRTSLNGGDSPSGNRGFTEELRNAWRSGKAPKLFVDEFRSPIVAQVTARAVWELVAQGTTGIFHVAGAERLSRYDIGALVAATCPDLNPRLEAGSIRDYPGPPRSPDTSLNSAKAQRVLSFPLPRFSDWLKQNLSVRAP